MSTKRELEKQDIINTGDTSENIGLEKPLIKDNLKIYDNLCAIYDKEIVDGAFKATENIQQFLGRQINIDQDKMNDACKLLSKYNDWDAYRGAGEIFDSNSANSIYNIVIENIWRNKKIPKNIEELFSYIKPGSTSVDLFAGGNGRTSSVNSSVLLHSLLGVENLLVVDLFHQNNKNIKNNVEDTFNAKYSYTLPQEIHGIVKLKNTYKNDNNDKNRKSYEYIPKFNLYSSKMDSLGALQLMSDDSLDSIMINNVDSDIVNDRMYIEKIHNEIRRVLKNKGIVFGWGSDWILPKDGDIIYDNDLDIFTFKIIQNNK